MYMKTPKQRRKVSDKTFYFNQDKAGLNLKLIDLENRNHL